MPILYIGIFLVWGFIIAPYKADHARQQILTADPQALLAACREMIANRAHYRDDWPHRSWADKGERAMQREKESTDRMSRRSFEKWSHGTLL